MNALATSREDWAGQITACWRKGFEAVIESGRLLTEAKKALDHGEWLAMAETDLPFTASTAQRLMAIAADERITNPAHVQFLPPHWGTLYELHKLDTPQFEEGIRTGKIRPDMERREVINGARSIMGSRQEPDDSLDYFPTAPWGTRALMERVWPVAVPSRRIASVWEPACGEGHMAEVLAEYCPAVVASDVHDYGYGQVIDFLQWNIKPSNVDWIITNPPFGDKAEQFVTRALAMAQVGVAMFFRQQWLETVGRFERIFRPHPPSLIAQFVERVPIHKGRWEPEGDTATAYLWIVWLPMRQEARGLTEFMWIPPGCREALTKPDDVERFTAHPVIRKLHAFDAAGNPLPHNTDGEVITFPLEQRMEA